MKINRQEIDKKLMFALHVVYAIDMLDKWENDPKQASGALGVLLTELGYSQEDAYCAAIVLQQTGSYDMLNSSDVTTALPSLVDLASNVIEKDLTPDFIREQVKITLKDLT